MSCLKSCLVANFHETFILCLSHIKLEIIVPSYVSIICCQRIENYHQYRLTSLGVHRINYIPLWMGIEATTKLKLLNEKKKDVQNVI
jgi:hypothetical protein